MKYDIPTGQDVRNERNRLGITQSELAEELEERFGDDGPAQNSLSRFERGKHDLKAGKLRMVCLALDALE